MQKANSASRIKFYRLAFTGACGSACGPTEGSRAHTGLVSELRGAEAALGKFDGLHKGHLEVISRLRGDKKAIISFFPAPQDFLQARERTFITTLRLWLRYLEGLGITHVVMLNFNRTLANTAARDFVRILHERLALGRLVVGEDFRFGKRALGDVTQLCEEAQKYALKVSVAKLVGAGSSVLGETKKHGSSSLRAFIARADFGGYKEVALHGFSILGRVVRGKRLGRELGFPTANLRFSRMQVLPELGVYAVGVTVLDALDTGMGMVSRAYGVASLGLNPTVENITRPKLEVYIFDFADDIVGCEVLVEFFHFLRAEQKFSSLEALKNAIAQDCLRARGLLEQQARKH